MLKLTHISFEYGDIPILKDISMTLYPGELCHIKGENGSGKSTLLKIIAGLISPTEGEILYQGKALLQGNISLSESDICYLGHKLGIHLALTVKENLLFDKHAMPFFPQQQDILLRKFKLKSHENQLCRTLSLGQRQRLALMRFAVTQASIWLLDEPFTGLDVETTAFFSHLCEQHLQKGGGIIMTSHHPLEDKLARQAQVYSLINQSSAEEKPKV